MEEKIRENDQLVFGRVELEITIRHMIRDVSHVDKLVYKTRGLMTGQEIDI